MKSLNKITSELVVSNMTLDLQQGEIDAMLENEILTLQKDLSLKVDHYHFRIKSIESRAEFLKEEGRRLIDVANSMLDHVDRMEATIKSTMTQLDVSKLEGEKYKFTVRPTSKVKVNIIDESLIPSEYKVLEQKFVVSKDTIRMAYENGKTDIPGVEIEQGQTLTMGIVK